MTGPVRPFEGMSQEATQLLVKQKTDNLDIALSVLRDAIIGTGDKSLTDLWNELVSTLSVSDSTTHSSLSSILTALGPLATDSKLEAVRALLAGTLVVTGPLTDTQLRASAVPVSASALPLPSGAATSSNQTTANSSLSSIDGGIGGASAAAAGDTGASTTNGFLRWLRDFWLSLKGTRTAANSVSVTGASDGVFYVGGVSADGVAPTNQAVRVSGVDAGGLKRTFATDTSGNQIVVQQPDAAYSGTISALYVNDSTVGGSLKVAVPAGARSVTIWLDAGGTLNGTVSARFVNSNGDQSSNVTGGYSYLSAVLFSTLSGAGSTAYTPLRFVVPTGTAYVIALCTAYTSGSATVRMAFSADPCSNLITGQITLQASATRLGSIFAPGIWYDDTSSALTANSTFTSTARDVTATASGSAFASGSTNAKEYRVMAEQDVAFTLQIQASRDNSAFRVVQSITATNISGGGYVAEAAVSPKWRYYRYAIVNGGSNAARTTGGSILMAS